MGVATCVIFSVAVLLETLLDFRISAEVNRLPQTIPLTVELRRSPDESEPVHVAGDEVEEIQLKKDVSVTEPPATQVDSSIAVSPEPQIDDHEITDWHLEIEKTLAATGNERARRELIRSSMWHQSSSIMFKSADEIVPREQEPAIPNFQFKPESRVAGIGVRIGSCFIGIPLVGVPVEERTAQISIVTCTMD